MIETPRREEGSAGAGPDLSAASLPAAPRIVIVGAGFAGLEVAKALGQAGLPAKVIDRRNHHLFQPLLYQVATAALSATDIAAPVRSILRDQASIEVLYAEVADIDCVERQVALADGGTLPFDYLILAAGSQSSYFGNTGWERFAPGLKSLEDAREIRSRLLSTFEYAERTADARERDRRMTVAVIGGGPTGVELAGAMAELSRYTLMRDFRNIDPSATKILLVEAGPRLLSSFSQKASDYARRRLEALGVTVLTDTPVKEIGENFLELAGERIEAGLVLWAAGVAATPLAGKLGVGTDRSGRVAVDASLRVEGCANVFALGDNAICLDEDGKPLPGLAQVAKQQGTHLGEELVKHIKTGSEIAPFRYRSRGNTAIVGRHAAVFEHGSQRWRGWLAWVSWAIVHVYLLIGFQNRLLVSVQWLWRYLTYERGARLIAGDARRSGAQPGAEAQKPVGLEARASDPGDRDRSG